MSLTRLEPESNFDRSQCEAAIQLCCHDRHEHTREQGRKAEVMSHLRLHQDKVRVLQEPEVEGMAELHPAQLEPQ